MSDILNKFRDIDPNDSEAVKEYVTSFFQNLAKTREYNAIKCIHTLTDLINRFPKYCMSHRDTVESLLVSALDATDYYYVIEAAKCSQALQQVRPSQEKTATPKSNWTTQMNLLCNAAHSLIGNIFYNALDIHKEPEKPMQQTSSNTILGNCLNKILLVPRKEDVKKDKQTIRQTRLKNIFCFIQAMLVEVYPVAKPVRALEVLDVTVRALSLSSGVVSPHVDISTVKIEAMRTLDALVACLGPNLIPFSPLVFKLLMQTIKWTLDKQKTEYSKVRCVAYSSLANWLVTLHTHRSPAGNRTSWEEELTNCIVMDITPPQKVVQLTFAPQLTKHMNKKAKRKLANAKLLESNLANHMPGEQNKIPRPAENNSEIAITALECAETFLMVCGRFLKPATHKQLQEIIIRECYKADSYPDAHVLCLLRVLEASRKTTPAGVPPPTQYCLQVYSVLVNSRHCEISKFCAHALLDIRLHLHCSPPSLNFALEVPQEAEKTTNKRKVSEKNKAALESLLGQDRMAELEPDEVTVAEEPSSKKARVEEISDNISISSESVQSIVIEDSDDDNVEIVEQDEPDGNQDKDEEEVEKDNEAAKPEIESTQAMEEDNVDETALQKPKEDEIVEAVQKDSEALQDENVAESVPETADTNVEIDQTQHSIHTAPTQMPLNGSTDTLFGEEEQLSLEVSYDYPNTGNEKVTVLNKVDDDVLPSTNDTDDVQITCGQVLRSSQDLDKRSDDGEAEAVNSDVNKVNGVDTETISKNNVVTNGIEVHKDDAVIEKNDETKIPPKEDGVSIEEMLADFVDEVAD